MNTVVNSFAPPSPRQLQVKFLVLLPRIETHAKIYFRAIACKDKRADRVAEAIALAWRWYVRLQERGKDAGQFPTAFARLLARAVKCGRRASGMEKAKDVMNERCQQRYGFKVESLSAPTRSLFGQLHGQEMQDAFEERLQHNLVSPIPDQVQFRIDFPTWLRTLTARERRIIRAMLRNERTKDLSRRFEVSAARISQLRRDFERGWNLYCGDLSAKTQQQAGVA